MKKEQIIRAWKDEQYRSSLTEAERQTMPEHPSGIVQLSEFEMEAVDGQTGFTLYTTWTVTFDYVCFPTMVCDTSNGCPPRLL